jgi:hypothetical protein
MVFCTSFFVAYFISVRGHHDLCDKFIGAIFALLIAFQPGIYTFAALKAFNAEESWMLSDVVKHRHEVALSAMDKEKFGQGVVFKVDGQVKEDCIRWTTKCVYESVWSIPFYRHNCTVEDVVVHYKPHEGGETNEE